MKWNAKSVLKEFRNIVTDHKLLFSAKNELNASDKDATRWRSSTMINLGSLSDLRSHWSTMLLMNWWSSLQDLASTLNCAMEFGKSFLYSLEWQGTTWMIQQWTVNKIYISSSRLFQFFALECITLVGNCNTQLLPTFNGQSQQKIVKWFVTVAWWNWRNRLQDPVLEVSDWISRVMDKVSGYKCLAYRIERAYDRDRERDKYHRATFIEPMITWVPSGFSGYIWLDTKIVLKRRKKLRLVNEVNPKALPGRTSHWSTSMIYIWWCTMALFCQANQIVK